MNYRPSSELQRAAEEKERNIERRIAWAKRMFKTQGRWPSLAPNGIWRRILEIRDQRRAMEARRRAKVVQIDEYRAHRQLNADPTEAA